ncbi:MAG TPA: amino acid adenylation domain-containing protein, partial [Methylovirgula sp.]
MVLAFDQLHRGRKAAEAAPPNLIHEFFEHQADQRSSHPAVVCKGETLTYAQLDRQSNQIAHFLRSQGIGPELLVGLYLRKSCRLFAAILGVLKAGAGYVPIDPQTPAERVRLIADDAKLTLLLTEDSLLAQLGTDLGIALTSLDDAGAEIARLPKSRLTAASTSLMPSNVCYVIYTSGSTGRPKGVVLEHRNVASYIAALKSHYGISKDDRVYQGFSVAFDASVEEIWAAFANGGTLVVAPEDVARSPHEAADFIRSRKLTVLSTVPTFLSLITAELPSVRLLIVGGEACPAQLVARWAKGKRRMLNTYGPTETAGVATMAECVPDEAVSIGIAMAGYSTRVLDKELHDVGVGEVGELYIGGNSLARGYMNLPDLTAEHFLTLPCQFQDGTERLYRTHDLVRFTPARTLEFLGRADDQVKVRGFRIELAEIEAVLMEHPSVRSAAVAVHEHNGMKEIAAYVVPSGGLGSRQKSGIADLLTNRLPDYMFPKYLEIVDELPTMNSGKVDRKRLPRPTTLFVAADRPHVSPATPIEAEIVRVWEEQLDVRRISVDADFFLDLRGNSFTAAHVATELRERLGTLQISSKDLYTYRTVRDLARHLVALGISASDPTAGHAPANAPKASSMQAMRVNILTRWTCVFLQTLSIGCFYAVVSAPLIYAILICERLYKGEMLFGTAITISTYVSLAMWPSWLVLSIALKWLVIGRYKPGRYPVWGFYYFRWWLVSRFQGIGWPEMFAGTPLMSLYYRAMGAKIGKGCTIGTPLCSAFDLVSIGDDSSIGPDAQLLGYRVENGWLILGTVDIGRECFIGMQTALGLNVAMQDRSRLEDMSLLPDGTVVAAGAQQAGSPPVEARVECPEPADTASRHRRGFLFGLLHLALIYVMGYVLILSILPSIILVWYCLHRWGLFAAALSVFVAVPVATIWYPTLTILIKRLFIGRIKPGTFPVASVRYLRYWFLDYMLNNTRILLLPVYATVFLPTFLRLMGARIGKGVEISTIMHVVPDLLDVGDGSFLADACIIGGHRIYRGLIDIRPNRIGGRTFIGNSALVPGGIDVGKDSLIGVLSTPPAIGLRAPDGSRWLGSPSF